MDKKDFKDEKLLYNVRETAAVLGVNVHLVYELINRKLLPALRLGSLKVRKSTLIVLLRDMKEWICLIWTT